jgi:hypothetical protein
MCEHESSYTLRGILLDAKRNLIIATDGRALAVIPAETDKNDETGQNGSRGTRFFPWPE